MEKHQVVCDFCGDEMPEEHTKKDGPRISVSSMGEQFKVYLDVCPSCASTITVADLHATFDARVKAIASQEKRVARCD